MHLGVLLIGFHQQYYAFVNEQFVGNAFMHSAPITSLSGYVEWKNVGQHRRAGGLPPPKRKDSEVSPLNGIRLDETVGNGLAHSVGEAAPRNRF